MTAAGVHAHGRHRLRARRPRAQRREASGVALRIALGRVPIHPGARARARRRVSGARRQGLAEATVRIERGLDPALVTLVFDAETSGGLLIAVAPERAAALEDELAAREQLVRRVGECVPASGAWVELA
jgi:selenide,water dikinase